MADYICPEKEAPCGEYPQHWCDGCSCPLAIEQGLRDERMAVDPLPAATVRTDTHQDGWGVAAYTADEMLAYGAAVRARCLAGHNVKITGGEAVRLSES